MTPNKYEIEALEMLAGKRTHQGGAWFNACMEFLGAMGLVTRLPPYTVTEKGQQYLKDREMPQAYGGNGENCN